METFTAGTVILVPFPFSDLSQSKIRPALILGQTTSEDFILCQITSNPYSDINAIELTNIDFQTGTLKIKSYIRPLKIFTCSSELFINSAGKISILKFNEVINSLVKFLNNSKKSVH